MSISRRTVVRGAAWTAPLVAVGVAVPVFAASVQPPQIKPNAVGGKCPGGSTAFRKGYIVPLELTGPVDSLVLAGLTYNGVLLGPDEFCVARASDTLYVISFDSSSSANASGVGSFSYSGTYIAGNFTGTANFSYNGTPPVPNNIRQTACAAAESCSD